MNIYKEAREQAFTFYCSSIKSYLGSIVVFAIPLFTFYCSSIKSQIILKSLWIQRNLHSIVVLLKGVRNKAAILLYSRYLFCRPSYIISNLELGN